MRSSATRCPHLKPFTFGIPPLASDDKLEFVEHVLGVLIESRFGNRNPYTRLGERPVTTGNSQLFANVRLLTGAEIQAHLEFGSAHHRPFYGAFLWELPLALANGSSLQNISGFSPTVGLAKARDVLDALNRWLKPTAIRRTQYDHSSMPRGSPTIPVRSSSRFPLRTLRTLREKDTL